MAIIADVFSFSSAHPHIQNPHIIFFSSAHLHIHAFAHHFPHLLLIHKCGNMGYFSYF